ncbi:MAG: mannose-6-phosphate isomerase [Actinomycetota bacterium]|nr:mannose-6-phosphate isomerase [Actinomycetota bacterium]
MTVRPDDTRLDDLDGLQRDDPSAMLRQVAGAGAQVREAASAAHEAGLARLAQDGRPRSVVVAGVGGSGISGDVLAAVAGAACPVPIVVHKGYGLPRWVGAADVVIGVSSSGTTEETLSAVEQAVSRGCSILGVGAADSPLAELVGRAHGPYVPVPSGRMPRVNLWALSVPLLLAGQALDLLSLGRSDVAAAADRLDETAERCRPNSESFLNPAKQLAMELAGTVPMVWGTSPVAGVAAQRMVCQLAENAKYPGIAGVLPEANHNQVVTFDGRFGALAGGAPEEFFRDRSDEPTAVRLRLVVLRDSEEHPQVVRRREASRELAHARGIAVTELVAEGDSALERLAALVGLPDFATVYLALLCGLDPTPIDAISDLKARIGR